MIGASATPPGTGRKKTLGVRRRLPSAAAPLLPASPPPPSPLQSATPPCPSDERRGPCPLLPHRPSLAVDGDALAAISSSSTPSAPPPPHLPQQRQRQRHRLPSTPAPPYPPPASLAFRPQSYAACQQRSISLTHHLSSPARGFCSTSSCGAASLHRHSGELVAGSVACSVIAVSEGSASSAEWEEESDEEKSAREEKAMDDLIDGLHDDSGGEAEEHIQPETLPASTPHSNGASTKGESHAADDGVPVKRKRGRPRKIRKEEPASAAPPKVPAALPKAARAVAPAVDPAIASAKRGRPPMLPHRPLRRPTAPPPYSHRAPSR